MSRAVLSMHAFRFLFQVCRLSQGKSDSMKLFCVNVSGLLGGAALGSVPDGVRRRYAAMPVLRNPGLVKAQSENAGFTGTPL